MKDNKKEFLRDCASYIRGEINEISLRGKKTDCIAIAAALKESRNLYDELNKERPDISCVVAALEKKRSSAQKLRATIGFVWPF